MIRVNLARNRVQDPALAQIEATDDSGEHRAILIKVAVMLAFLIGLVLFEGQNIRALNEERNRLNNAATDLETQAASKAQEVEGIKDIAKQAKELEDKLKILKLLSKLRLREVKTLDFMQSSIPEKVWLRAVNYDADKTLMEQGRFQFQGNAMTTEDLTEFVKRLEDSAYLKEVIVVKNQEITGTTRPINLREFQFSAQVEFKN